MKKIILVIVVLIVSLVAIFSLIDNVVRVPASMEKGAKYCPAPSPASSNKQWADKITVMMDCEMEGKCLSPDGTKCIDPIIWGVGAPPIEEESTINLAPVDKEEK